MSKRAVIRVDFGERIGFGHLTRCIGLAEKLLSHDFEVWIVSSTASVDSRSMISEKFRFCTFETSDDLSRLLDKISPDVVIVDLLERHSKTTEKKIIENFVFSSKVAICFDNYFSEEIPFDFFIGPRFFANSGTHDRLEGLKYILFRDSFLEKRKGNPFINRDFAVLITLGNIDPFDISYRLVNLLVKIFDISELYVVIGSGFSDWNTTSLIQLASKFKNIKMITNATDLSDYFASCDMAFVSGGQSKFEASLLGSYPMIISNTDEEFEAGSVYHDQELGTFLCDARDFDPIKISQKISFLIDEQEMLLQRRQRAFQTLDGRGSERIVQKLIALYEQRR